MNPCLVRYRYRWLHIQIFRGTYITWVYIHRYISVLCAEKVKNLGAYLVPTYCFLIPLCNKRNWSSLEKSLTLGSIQEIYKMSLEHLVPEGKEVLQLPPPAFHIDEDMSEEHRDQLKKLPVAKIQRFEQQNKAALDYNP